MSGVSCVAARRFIQIFDRTPLVGLPSGNHLEFQPLRCLRFPLGNPLN